MTGGFDGQLAVLTGSIQTDGFIDHIAVAPLEAVMDAALFCDEFGKAGGGDGVGDNSGAGMLTQEDGREHGDDAVAVQFASI